MSTAPCAKKKKNKNYIISILTQEISLRVKHPTLVCAYNDFSARFLEKRVRAKLGLTNFSTDLDAIASVRIDFDDRLL